MPSLAEEASAEGWEAVHDACSRQPGRTSGRLDGMADYRGAAPSRLVMFAISRMTN